jgi:hypothetical protein
VGEPVSATPQLRPPRRAGPCPRQSGYDESGRLLALPQSAVALSLPGSWPTVRRWCRSAIPEAAPDFRLVRGRGIQRAGGRFYGGARWLTSTVTAAAISLCSVRYCAPRPRRPRPRTCIVARWLHWACSWWRPRRVCGSDRSSPHDSLRRCGENAADAVGSEGRHCRRAGGIGHRRPGFRTGRCSTSRYVSGGPERRVIGGPERTRPPPATRQPRRDVCSPNCDTRGEMSSPHVAH